MKKHLQKLTLLIIGMLISTTASADFISFKVDGIYYATTTTESTAYVSCLRGPNLIYNTNSYYGDVVIPKYVTYNGKTYKVTGIDSYAFAYCLNLTSVTIPNSIATIGGHAFEGSSRLTSITIPNSVTEIRTEAFYKCTGLTSVTIPNSVTEIGFRAFGECSGLTSVTIGSGVTSIGSSAFYSCSNLTSVHITDIAKWCEIEFGNFYANPLLYAGRLYLNNKRVREVVIPENVTQIKDYTFYNCDGLTSVTIGNNVKTIGEEVFRSCDDLTSVTIGDGVTSIGLASFIYCPNLTSVTIGNNVTTIGNEAFRYCDGLTSVTIGEDVKTIGNNAFASCSGLAVINSLNPIPAVIESNTFSGVDKSSCVLNVPIGSKIEYELETYWEDFLNINEVDFAGVDDVTVDGDVVVTVIGGKIVVNGVDGDAVVEVYSTTGQLVYRGEGTEIAVPGHGIYIVKVADKTVRIAL